MDPLLEIAAALKAIASTTSPEYTYTLEQLPGFDWSKIGAVPIEGPDGNAIAVEWMSAHWGRIDGDKCVSFCRICVRSVLILVIFGNPDQIGTVIDAEIEDELTG